MTLKNLQSISNRFLSVTIVSSIRILLSFDFLSSNPAFSQIVPDNTLAVPSQVTIDGSLHTIEGGTEAGSNLFHSFQDFSVPTGSEAFFNNATTVENILTRVTGGNISNIDGLIRANGTANLFLLNPNGIVFGPNAQLNIGGSFFGTTASSLVFENGLEFSATSPEARPLLSVNVPIGLQMGQNPEDIRVRGTGHNLTFRSIEGQLFPPFERENNPLALTVRPGQTLALIGGDVTLEGGQLVAQKGRVELGSVRSGRVSLSDTASGWVFDYGNATNFGNIQLSQQAAVDASGAGRGGIFLTGRQVSLTDGSVALIQNAEATPAGTIAVTALESLELIGTTPDGSVRSSLHTETDYTGIGASGNIHVSTGRLLLDDGAQIMSRTFGIGEAGNITVEASDSIQILGTSPLNSWFFSSIFAIGSGDSFGNSGDINISTGQLTILDGGIISAGAFGDGSAGTLTVRAAESVEIIGRDPIFESPSDLSVSSFRSGDAGNLLVETQRLVMRNGGRVRASTIGLGNAGSIMVNASQLVEVSSNSTIESSANFPSAVAREVGVEGNPSGQAGGITIDTERLIVRDGGEVTVQNIGEANGGKLQVNANSILLDGEGTLTASTASGEGGNIQLSLDDSLLLRNGSFISAEAGGADNGGNIAIDAETIALLEGSSIDANAFEGSGGNIEIATQGLFLSPDSSITASSQLGVDGIVTVTQPEIDTSSALVSLSDAPIDPTTQIVSACSVAAENTFVVNGNGGLPPDPTDVLRGEDIWVDLRLSEDLEVSPPIEASPSEAGDSSKEESSIDPTTDPVVEATNWQRHQDGTVELVAAPQGRVGNRWLDRPVCRE
ncbi:MAG: S-layer family protein [Cyanobacteria bacterium SID2]|nr:S-layer family protein [Cyanobacteria bacterium SID2]